MALDIKTAAELATLIPTYDGNPTGVKSFVDAVNLVKTIVPAEKKNAAIQIILTKLSGKARNLFATTPENYDCITQMLINNCSDKSTSDLAKTNLSNLKLKSADDIQNFSKQVDLLAEKLNETYIREQIPSDAAKRMTMKAAIQTMVENSTNSETRMMLKVGKFDNLQEAINVMIENEKPTNKTSNSVVLNATRMSNNNRFQDTRQNTQQRNSDGYRRGNSNNRYQSNINRNYYNNNYHPQTNRNFNHYNNQVPFNRNFNRFNRGFNQNFNPNRQFNQNRNFNDARMFIMRQQNLPQLPNNFQIQQQGYLNNPNYAQITAGNNQASIANNQQLALTQNGITNPNHFFGQQ